VTQPVTFEITLQAETDSRVSGTASAIIKRSDFNISIPSVPFVADVGEEITLELNFVLAPGGG
jgi:polyisoprenoid-binding protein YceI